MTNKINNKCNYSGILKQNPAEQVLLEKYLGQYPKTISFPTVSQIETCSQRGAVLFLPFAPLKESPTSIYRIPLQQKWKSA